MWRLGLRMCWVLQKTTRTYGRNKGQSIREKSEIFRTVGWKQSQSILVKISLIGGTTHKDVVWEEAGLLESVCSALGLLTCKYNRQEKRLYSQTIGLKREQTDSNSHASCHTTSLSVVLSLQSTIISDTFFTTLRNPNNQWIHLFLEVFSVLLLQCICQYSGPAIL